MTIRATAQLAYTWDFKSRAAVSPKVIIVHLQRTPQLQFHRTTGRAITDNITSTATDTAMDTGILKQQQQQQQQYHKHDHGQFDTATGIGI